MTTQNFHKHPIGARFVKKQPDNRWAVKLAKDMVADFGCRGNGWHSWWDGNISSADFGLWVLYNVATGDTYVQKIFNPYNLPIKATCLAASR